MNKPYDVGLVCGRFQTFHKGHESLVETAEKLLKFGGKLFMVHRTDRLVDVLSVLRNKKFSPKVFG